MKWEIRTLYLADPLTRIAYAILGSSGSLQPHFESYLDFWKLKMKSFRVPTTATHNTALHYTCSAHA